MKLTACRTNMDIAWLMIFLVLLAIDKRPLMAFQLQQQQHAAAFRRRCNTRDNKKTVTTHSRLTTFDPTVKKLSSDSNNNNNNKDLNDLYQTVAQQDPDWFQTYVVQMIGDDSDLLDEGLVQVMTLAQKEIQQSKRARLRQEEQEGALQRLWQLQQQQESLDDDDDDDDDATTRHIQTVAEEKNRTVATEPTADRVSIQDDLLVSSSSSSSSSSLLANQTANTATATATTTIGSEQNATTTTRSPQSPTPTISIATNQRAENATGETLSEEESNKTASPATIPALKEKAPTILNDSDKKDGDGSQSQAAASTMSGFISGSKLDNSEASFVVAVGQQQDEKHAKTIATKQNVTATSPQTPTMIPSDTSGVNGCNTTTATEDNRVVLYQKGASNSDSSEWKTYPLSKLSSLGYSPDDIISMDPDALALIIRESLSRPRSGIPSRWKSSSSDETNVVQIVASEAAAEEMARQQTVVSKADWLEASPQTETESNRKKLELEQEISMKTPQNGPVDEATVTQRDTGKSDTDRKLDSNIVSTKNHTIEGEKQAVSADDDSRARNENLFLKVRPKKNTTAVAGIAKERLDKETKAQTRTESPEPKQSDEREVQKSLTEKAKVPPSDDLDGHAKRETPENTTKGVDTLVALFQESGPNKKWKTYPVQKLASLGYSRQDISSMDPDALALIIQENLSRPRSGIPPRWKSTSEKDHVQLVSRTKAEELIRTYSSASEFRAERSQPAADSALRADSREPQQRENIEPQISTKRRPTKGSFSNPEIPPRVSFGNEELPQGRTRQQVRERPERSRPLFDEKEKFRERRRQERTRPIGDSADNRRVYSGRPNERRKSRQLPDDPPPPTGFWPDIDKFRSMLRDEASLRLRLLGDDWAGVVKEESDWRLGLYEKWLWVLHNGVGTPIVESRMDRMRRMEQQNAGRKRHAAAESARRRKRKLSKD